MSGVKMQSTAFDAAGKIRVAEVGGLMLYVKNLGVTMGLANVVNIPKLLKMIEAGALDLTPLITHRMALSDGVKAYEIFEQRLEDVIEIALEPGSANSVNA